MAKIQNIVVAVPEALSVDQVQPAAAFTDDAAPGTIALFARYYLKQPRERFGDGWLPRFLGSLRRSSLGNALSGLLSLGLAVTAKAGAAAGFASIEVHLTHCRSFH